MLCRFYGFGLDKVMGMTLRVFTIMTGEIGNILKMEHGGNIEKEEGLTGDAGFALAQRIFPRGRK